MSASLANDKLSIPHRFNGGNSTLNSRVKTNGFCNVIQADEVEFASGDGKLSALTFVGENGPGTDYDSYALPGDKYMQVTFTASVPVTYKEYVRTAGGWAQAILGGDLTTSYVATAAAEMGRMWGSTTAQSGIFRGLSVRTRFTVAGTATGDAGRFYNWTDVSIANMHGIHATANVGAEDGLNVAGGASAGTITGQAAGVRATIGIGLSNGVAAGGTLASIRLDTYFLSTAASAATSFIYACDVGGSYGADAFLRMGPIVNSVTDKSAKLYNYVMAGITPSNSKHALKCISPTGVVFYLIGYETLG